MSQSVVIPTLQGGKLNFSGQNAAIPAYYQSAQNARAQERLDMKKEQIERKRQQDQALRSALDKVFASPDAAPGFGEEHTQAPYNPLQQSESGAPAPTGPNIPTTEQGFQNETDKQLPQTTEGKLSRALTSTPGAGQEALSLYQQGEKQQLQQRKLETKREQTVLDYAAKGQFQTAQHLRDRYNLDLPDDVLNNQLAAAGMSYAGKLYGEDADPSQVATFTKAFMQNNGDLQKAIAAAGTPDQSADVAEYQTIMQNGQRTKVGLDKEGNVVTSYPAPPDKGGDPIEQAQTLSQRAKEIAINKTEGVEPPLFDPKGQPQFTSAEARQRFQQNYDQIAQRMANKAGIPVTYLTGGTTSQGGGDTGAQQGGQQAQAQEPAGGGQPSAPTRQGSAPTRQGSGLFGLGIVRDPSQPAFGTGGGEQAQSAPQAAAQTGQQTGNSQQDPYGYLNAGKLARNIRQGTTSKTQVSRDQQGRIVIEQPNGQTITVLGRAKSDPNMLIGETADGEKFKIKLGQ